MPAGLDGLRRSLTGLAFLSVGVGAWWWLTTHHFGGATDPAGHVGPAGHAGPTGHAAGAGGDQPAGDAQAASNATQAAGLAAMVALPASAQSAAGIVLATVEVRPLREQLTVPGRIDYDARHRLDYAAPVDGIVSQVFVQVRQRVSKGDALAELSSPDVGVARDDVRRREDNRMIEKKTADWATTIGDNVAVLLDLLGSEPPLADIERQFKDRILGAYREKILGAYSRRQHQVAQRRRRAFRPDRRGASQQPRGRQGQLHRRLRGGAVSLPAGARPGPCRP